MFGRLVSQDLIDYRARPLASNIGWMEKQAFIWFQRNPSVVVVDCDKNLGDALFSREWVTAECRKQLAAGFKQIDEPSYLAKTEVAQDHLRQLVESSVGKRIIKPSIGKYLSILETARQVSSKGQNP